jgi:hypothetical protein
MRAKARTLVTSLAPVPLPACLSQFFQEMLSDSAGDLVGFCLLDLAGQRIR